MPTITAGNSATFALQPDQTITLTTVPGTEGSMLLNGAQAPTIGDFGPPALVNKVFGPGVAGTVTLSVKNGSATYALSASSFLTYDQIRTLPLSDAASLAAQGCVGGADEAVKFQAAIDALPAAGGVITCEAKDYSATTASGLNTGNKAVVWSLPSGGKLPTDLPGVVFNRGRFSTTTVSVEANRNGRIWNKQDYGTNLVIPAGTIDRANYVEGFLADDPAVSTQREFHAFGFRVGTNHHEPNGGDVRGMKGIVYGNGGQANLRSAHFLVEGFGGHTGDITGVLADVFHSDSADGVAAPVGRSAAFVGQVGPGIRDGYTLRSGVRGSFGKQRPNYGYRVEDGTLAVLPEVACFWGHGGGNGDFFRMAASDTDGTVIANLDNKAKLAVQAARSGVQSIADQAAFSFTPVCTTGFIFVMLEGNSAHWIIRFFRVGASPVMGAIAQGATAASTTGVLTGTTGTAGNLTISADAGGQIYIENRSGAVRNCNWFIVGRS